MSENIKRMKYTTGLFMDDSEFQAEQSYNMRMRRMHNRHLHTPGIAWGLGLEIEGPLSIQIKKGMALDLYFDQELGEELSREVFVATDEVLTIPDNSYPAGSDIFVWIEYREIEADSSEKAGGGNIHIMETFIAGHGVTPPLDGGRQILLGKAVLNASGAIDRIEYLDAFGNSLRRYAGFTGKEWQTDRLTLSDDAIAENKPFLDATVFDDDRSGITVNSERTQLTGVLNVLEGATVNGALTTSSINIWNQARTQHATIVNNVTAHRTVTIPDRDFTIADDADLQGEIANRENEVATERSERIAGDLAEAQARTTAIATATDNIRYVRTTSAPDHLERPVYFYQQGTYLYWNNTPGAPRIPFA